MFGGLLKSTSRLALVAAAATAVGGVAAQAADLGGNCCADLEERVADLEATTARKGNRKVSLTVSGVIDKSIVWHDHTSASSFRGNQIAVRDGDQTGTRVRFVGSARVNADVTFGYNLELNINENQSANTNVSGIASLGAGSVLIRQSHFFATSKTLGSVAVGQLSAATDGIFQINLSNARSVMGADLEGGNIGGRLTQVFAQDDILDGVRMQGVRYTTPTFAGFTMQAGYYHADQDLHSSAAPAGSGPFATDSREEWDVALRYAGEFSGFRLAAGIGYREVNNIVTATGSADAKVWAGSGSIMHVPTGLFVAGGYGDSDMEASFANTNNRSGYWGMAGIEQNWFGIGKTTLFGEYIVADFHVKTAGACTGGAAVNTCLKDGTAWGLGITQAVDAAATNLYLSYRNYESDSLWNRTGTGPTDVQAVVGGVQINF